MFNKAQSVSFLKKAYLVCTGVLLAFVSSANAQEATFGGGYPHALKLQVEDLARAKGYPAFGGSTAAAFLRTEGGSGSGSNWYGGTEHLPTLQRVCSILGYRTYVRSTCQDFERSSRYPNGKCNFHSPDTDDIIRFNTSTNSFRPEHADPKYGKTFVATITCKDPIKACSDGIDNDGDGKVDLNDPGCSNPDDNDETDLPGCSDGRDNDWDGKIDYPADPGCTGPNDNDETDQPACKDGRDNDYDGKIDYPADPGCSNPNDTDETDPSKPECSDGIDNDGDGATDYPADFSCSSPNDDDETYPKSQCQDKVDNDGDGKTDLADPGCANQQDNDEGDDLTPNNNYKLTPIGECVETVGNGTYVARFGYQNDNAGPITVNIGLYNGFSQAPISRGQPVNFQAGRIANAFSVTFDGQPLQWVLGNSSVIVSSASTPCTVTPPPAPDCIDSNISGILISMDSGAKAQLNAINKALKQLKKANPKEVTFANKVSRQAADNYKNAWTTTWTIPQNITSCTNASQCAKADFLSTVNTYNSYSTALKSLSDQVAKRLAKIKNNKATKKAATTLTNKAAALHDANLKSSASVPRYDDQC